MRINEVYLENFKNLSQETFTFSQGTNAICGPNGSGKTSILEAIAWALFDYLPYKNQEHIIKLTATGIGGIARPQSAKVQVYFTSSLDNKEYVVFRSTKRQYYIVDRETNERMAEGKREVLPFLMKHFNLSGNINLDELFTNTIGVPQGNFTSIFKDTNTNRKKIFDKVLNIEEYREAYEKLRDFKSFLKDQQNEINLSLTTFEADLSRIGQVEKDIHILTKDNICISKDLEEITSKLSSLEKSFNELNILKESIQKHLTEIEKLEISKKHHLNTLEETNKRLKEALEASNNIKKLIPEYNAYLDIKENVTKLEQTKDKYIKLNNHLNHKEKEVQTINSTIDKYNEKLALHKELSNKIKSIGPLCNKQKALELNKSDLERQNQKLKEIQTSLNFTYKEIEDLKDQINFVEEELKEIEQFKTLANSYKQMETKHQELHNTLTEIKSLINENNNYLNQVKGGLCPFLKEQCKNISEDQNLETFFIEKLTLLENELKENTKDFRILEKELTLASKAKEKLQKLDFKQQEKEKLLSKITRINQDITNTEKVRDTLLDIPQKLNKLIDEIKLLGSPKDKISALTEQLPDKAKIESSLKGSLKYKERLMEEIEGVKSDIKALQYSPEALTEAKNNLIKLEIPYKKYIELQVIVKELNDLKPQKNKIEQDVKKIEETLTENSKNLNILKKEYNEDNHKLIKTELEKKKISHTRAEQILKTNEIQVNKLNKELQELLKIKEKIKEQTQKQAELQQIESFIDTSRDIFKDCGPLVAQFYIENISLEANNIYQEITMSTGQNLSWNLDYEILVEENGLDRTFLNLSGGEQMAAALAVRLALLRELSDINIAFFDEPTTNMDEIRRSNLAEQIKNITSFDQLFVISHDDTFEKDIDNVIKLN